ncbi:hypothetical protein GCM10007301_11270 [Azorhizobium oxalatiphilum]|uniref:DUF2948 family protein n=1 Tax=Azorhizobium oxalatiphilum TaxID=980631 RepID=A0A917BNZ5_9HYPH|nr:DUF2948 family protein [Azorhizobium oxalatiphilum]GGF53573.1 hypothetical protein GCM10007301_11270 [Azorhizobium oxalatiphilum]
MDELKLFALDDEDLAVISTHLQDAVVKVGDMGFVPKSQRFALLLNRFDWDQKADGGTFVRRRSGLHFERVRNVKVRGFDLKAQEQVLNLLAITFLPTEEPSGLLQLTFSGGAEIRLEVECIEAGMSDLGPAWGCPHKPEHRDSVA